MTNKQNTLCGIVGLFLGIVGGIAGTAFSMGADRQRVNDILIRHTSQMADLASEDEKHEDKNNKELNRLTQIISDEMNRIQLSLTNLAYTVADVRTDIQVIKALMERMENDLKNQNKR